IGSGGVNLAMARGRRVTALAGFCLLALVNCGGGGGGGDSGGGGSTVVAGFTATCAIGDPCDSNAGTLQRRAANGNVAEVQIRVNKLTTLIGAAGLDVGFDPNSVDYLGFTEGPALGTGSGTTYLVTKMNGEVIVSITPSIPKSLLSADVLITLSFK